MTPTLTEKLSLIDRERGEFAFGRWKNFTVIVWGKRATGPSVERLARVNQAAIDDHPEGISNIHLITRGAGAPTAEARAGFVQQMRDWEKKLACIAIVLPGRTFAVAALRAAVLGIRAAAPGAFAFRLHDDVADVARWLPREHLKRTSVLVHPTELDATLKDAWALFN